MEVEEKNALGAAGKTSAEEDCSVCVAVHIRPLIATEVSEGCQACLSVVEGQKQVRYATADSWSLRINESQT